MKMKLVGNEEAVNRLMTLPIKVAEKGLKASATAGGTIIARAVRRLVPRVSGLLKRSIDKKVKLYKKSETAAAIIGANKSVQGEYRGNLRKPSKYIALVEGGAQPHGYKTRKGMHPGFAGRHPIQQASASAGPAALEAAQNKLHEVIDREVERLGGGIK